MTDAAMTSAEMKSPAEAFRPVRLSRSESLVRTTVAQRARAIPVPIAQTTWQFDLQPVVNASDCRLQSSLNAWSVELTWAGARFLLQLPAPAVIQIIEPMLGGGVVDDLPDDLAKVVLEAALSDVSEMLQALGHGTPHIESVTQHGNDDQDGPPHVCRLRLCAQDDSAVITGLMHTDELGLQLIAGLLSERSPAAWTASDGLSVSLRAEIGMASMPAKMAAEVLPTLERGDVLLMARCYLDAQRVLWLAADGIGGLHVQVPATDNAPAAPTLTIIRSWTNSMPTTDANDVTDTAGHMLEERIGDTATVVSPDDIPVRLSFDLGTVSLTYSQARALQPGQVITLDHPLSGVVSIRANGVLIGDGDLVEIDGQLGVSIRSLAPTAQSGGH